MNGWLVIESSQFRAMLERAHGGESPEMLEIEVYANSEHEETRND